MSADAPFLAKLTLRSTSETNGLRSVRPRVSREELEQNAGDSATQPFILRFATLPLRLERRDPPGTIATKADREPTDVC
jgi:hypothetical protein